MQSIKRFGIIVVALGLMGVLIYWLKQNQADALPGNSYSVLPPLVGIVMALVTKRLYLSLTIAVVLGGVLVEVPKDPADLSTWIRAGQLTLHTFFLAISDKTNLMILGFAISIIMMISIISAGGGLKRVVALFSNRIRGRKSAQWMTFLSGVIVFIDDYANTMIVGSSMRPLTDRWRISREKLAFLVDSTSAPICGLAIVSTWIGFEVGLFASVGESLNIDRDGYAMFLDALSYRFYCIFMLTFIAINIFTGKDFGPMKAAEIQARTTKVQNNPYHDLNTNQPFQTTALYTGIRPSAWIALTPIMGLFVFLLIGLWHDGGGPDLLKQGRSLFELNYWFQVITNADNNIRILFHASIFSLILASLLSVAFARLPLSVLFITLLKGLKTSLLPLFILILAWSLKTMCDHLQTGEYLAATAGRSVSPMIFPLIAFLLACFTSFATGTSWGTMAILIPTVIPVAFVLNGDSYGLLVIVSMGAILDGAIFGDHCSPISDTTIMSSVSTQCNHIDHVRTQLPYSLFVGILAILCGYLPVAMAIPVVWSYASAILLLALWYLLLPRFETEQ